MTAHWLSALPTLGVPTADAHAHLDMLEDPAAALANAALAGIALVATVVDLTEDERTFTELATWQADAAKRLSAAGRADLDPPEVRFVVGAHPIDHIAAVMRLPVDELGLVAALRDAPLPVVKCVSNDIRVPADAEWVLEGYLDPRGHVEAEGPYGEFLGYYGALKRNPVFHLTAITRRHDALFQTSTIGG